MSSNPVRLTNSILTALVIVIATHGSLAAAEVKIASAAGLTPIVKQLGKEFEAATGHKLVVKSAAADALAKEIEGGASFDLAILTAVRLNGLIKQGKVVADTRHTVALSGTGVAIKAGETKPDISTPDAFKKAMLDATAIAVVKGGNAARQLIKIFQKLEIADQMTAKVKLEPTLIRVAQALTSGEAQFGLASAPVLAPMKGIELIGPLPGALQTNVVFAAGVLSDAAEPDGAKEFLKLLSSAKAVELLKARGFEPGAN